jgi:hypothetical protein
VDYFFAECFGGRGGVFVVLFWVDVRDWIDICYGVVEEEIGLLVVWGGVVRGVCICWILHRVKSRKKGRPGCFDGNGDI